MGIVIIIVFILVIVGLVFMVLRTLKKLDSSSEGVAKKSSDVKNSQEFLPFANVENNVIDLGGLQYRMIIECSSTNYHLKTVDEQNVLELSFKNFLSSIEHPYSFFIQNREINLTPIIEGLRKDIIDTVKVFPALAEYGEDYYAYLNQVKEYTGCSKQKRKYIIVPFDDAVKMQDLTLDAKIAYAQEQVRDRAERIVDGLTAVGITGHILNTDEIIELLYSLNHRNDDKIVNYLSDGSFTSELVCGTFEKEQSELDKGIKIIEETINKYSVSVVTNNLTLEQKNALGAILSDLSKIKQTLGNYKSAGGFDSITEDISKNNNGGNN